MYKRHSVRATVELPVKVAGGSVQLQGVTRDIGLTGLAVAFKQAQPMPEKVFIDLKLAKVHIKTWARTIWTHETGSGMYCGFEFVDLAASHHTQLADFIGAQWLNENHYL